jgi:hypothetical protein
VHQLVNKNFDNIKMQQHGVCVEIIEAVPSLEQSNSGLKDAHIVYKIRKVTRQIQNFSHFPDL